MTPTENDYDGLVQHFSVDYMLSAMGGQALAVVQLAPPLDHHSFNAHRGRLSSFLPRRRLSEPHARLSSWFDKIYLSKT